MPTFPAHDEEPPPRPLWQVFLGVLVGAVLVGPVLTLAIAGLWVVPGQHAAAAARAGTSLQLGGRLLVLDVTSPRTRQRAVPVHGGSLSPCLWSPSDAYLLCDDYSTNQRYVIQVSPGRTQGPHQISPDRYALAWQPEEAS